MNLFLRILLLLASILFAVFIFILLYAVCTFIFNKIKKVKKENTIKEPQENAKKKKQHYLKKNIVWYKKFVILHKSIISIVLFIGIMIGFPLALQNNWMNISKDLKNYIKIGTTRDWFGFWSSYIGSIMAIVFAYFNTRLQIKNRIYKEDANLIFDLKEYTSEYYENIMQNDIDKIIDIIDKFNKVSYDKELIANVFSFWNNFNKFIDSYKSKSGYVSYSTYKKLNRIMDEYLKNKRYLDYCLQCQISGIASDSIECETEIDKTLKNFEKLIQRLNNLYDYLRIRS